MDLGLDLSQARLLVRVDPVEAVGEPEHLLAVEHHRHRRHRHAFQQQLGVAIDRSAVDLFARLHRLIER
jgi:hypothetical protein